MYLIALLSLHLQLPENLFTGSISNSIFLNRGCWIWGREKKMQMKKFSEKLSSSGLMEAPKREGRDKKNTCKVQVNGISLGWEGIGCCGDSKKKGIP
jgi:hypothetical protein